VSYSVGTVKRHLKIKEVEESEQREKAVKSVIRENLGSRSTIGDVLAGCAVPAAAEGLWRLLGS
jgi:hypothetical protein